MEPQSVTMPTRSIKSLRSNSIRNQQGNGYVGLNVKVNLKKFPLDFFHMESLPSARLAPRSSNSKQGHKTQRKLSTNLASQFGNQKQMLPQAKITSFFNIGLESSDTNDTNPSKNEGFPSETKLTVSDLDRMISREDATSIELNDRNENQLDMCCTFSKIPVSKSNFVTPSRQRSNNFSKQKLDQKCQSALSTRVTRRASTKLGTRDANMQKSRKESLEKRGSCKFEDSARQILGTKLGRRETDQGLCLPQIGRNNN